MNFEKEKPDYLLAIQDKINKSCSGRKVYFNETNKEFYY